MKRLLGSLALGLATIAASAQWTNPADDIPAFDQHYKAVVYAMAAKVPAVLHQQPCYCRCDREAGHNSLHSCFESTHGAACSTCMREAIYSYQQTKKGKTPAQIRAGIERGEWQNVDLLGATL
jgi:hypothetical protein